MHRVGVRRPLAAWALRLGLALLACTALLGGLWPAGQSAAASALPGPERQIQAPVPFLVWRFDEETGWSRALGYPASRTAWGLAEFVPSADVDLTAVEFWTTDAADDVDIYLYAGFDGTIPGNQLAQKMNSAFDSPGFHSVALDESVPASGGTSIVVVVKITNASRGHPLLLDTEERGDRLRTFASPTGNSGSWYDVGASGHGALAISISARPAAVDLADKRQYRAFLPLVTNRLAPSTAGWKIIKEEGFEDEFPGEWRLSDQNPAEGFHVLGQRTCRPHSGTYSGWVVGSGAGAELGCQSAYPRHVESWMVYGPFSLADASYAELAFQLWLNSEPEFDGIFSGASIDGVEFHGYTVTGNSAGWMQSGLNLRSVPVLGDVTGHQQVWIALLFVSDGVVRMQEGAYIDDIVLRKYVGTPSDAPEEMAPGLGGTAQRREATFSLRH